MGELGAMLGAVATILIALLAFTGRKLDSRVDEHEHEIAHLKTEIAVIAAAKLGERIEKHDALLHEMAKDIHTIKDLLERK